MFLSTNAQEVSRRYGHYVQKFQNILAMHGVSFGSPEDLHGFMEKLTDDKHFAMDFWALAGFLSSREDGNLCDQEMLVIIVFSVGGPDVPTSDSHINQLVEDIASLLAGVDVSSPQAHLESPMHPSVFDPNVNPDVTRYSLEIPPVAAAAFSNGLSAEPSTDMLDMSDMSRIDVGDSDPPRSFTIPYQLNEALSRLESNSRKLELHLDIIDNRVSRMEPHLDSITDLVATKLSPPTLEDPAQPAPQQFQTPATAHEEAPVVGSQMQPSPIPLKRSFFQSHIDRNHALFAAAMVLLTVAAGAFLHHGHSANAEHIVPRLLNVNLSNRNAAAVTVPAAAVVSPTASVPTAVESAPPPASQFVRRADGQKQSPARSLHRPHLATIQAVSYNRRNTLAGSPSFANGGQTSSADFADGHVVGDSQDGQLYAEATSPSDLGVSGSTLQPIKVSSGVMAANLIASPSPGYPRLARIAHIQGPVVLQAVISRDGTVDQLRVIQGHRLLRRAAENAVSTWRYRPYLINGKPAEISTLVTVDFNLNK